MNITTLFFQCLLTVPLTILLFYCNNRKRDRILLPTIYMLIVAALFPQLTENIFLIVVLEIIVRNFYINDRTSQNNLILISENILSIVISILTYYYFVIRVDTVLPSPEEIKAFLWFLIIIYLITIYNKGAIKQTKLLKINKELVVMQYAKYKTKYKQYINTENQNIENLLYAIMIYENMQQPLLLQKIEQQIKHFKKEPQKYGIMRVESSDYINDEESISFVEQEIIKNTNENKINYKEALKKYSYQEQETIKRIHRDINNF